MTCSKSGRAFLAQRPAVTRAVAAAELAAGPWIAFRQQPVA